MKISLWTVREVVRSLSLYQTALHHESLATQDVINKAARGESVADAHEHALELRTHVADRAADSITALTDMVRRVLLAHGLDLDALVEADRAGNLEALLSTSIQAVRQ